MSHVLLVVALCPGVDIVKGEEQVFLTRFGIDEITLLHIGIYQFLSPPGEKHILGLHTVVVIASVVQVFQ